MSVFFNQYPEIQAYDTETNHGDLLTICSADNRCYDYNGNNEELLEWIITNSKDLNFFYNIDYDFSVIIKPFLNGKIKETGKFKYGNYEFTYISNKSFTIRNKNQTGKHKLIRFFDIAQFYKLGSQYQPLDKIANNILGKGKNNEELGLSREEIGNMDKNKIKDYFNENKEKIHEYCINDAFMTCELSKIFINGIKESFDFIPKKYNSAASLSKAYLYKNHNDQSTVYYRLLSKLSNQKKIFEANTIIRNTYHGGLIYVHKLGLSKNVFEYDLNSAYPAAYIDMYSIDDADIQYVNEYTKADYGFYRVKMKNLSNLPIPHRTGKQSNVYMKSHKWIEAYLTAIEIEYFREYHNKDIQIEIIEGYIVDTDKKKAFFDYKKIYEDRREIKAKAKLSNDKTFKIKSEILQNNKKLILNSTYGVFAEIQHGLTSWSNFVYASYITAETRLKIYKAIDKIGWDHIIAIMTDAISTDKEITDPDFNSNELGKFKKESNFEYVILYMNGIYITKEYGIVKPQLKDRGFPSLKYDDLLNAQGNTLSVIRDRPIKVKEAIRQHKIKDIGDFQNQKKEINLLSNLNNYLLDKEKLTFEYLKDNFLETEYLEQDDIEYEYSDKPYLLQLNTDYKNKFLHYMKIKTINPHIPVLTDIEIYKNEIINKIDKNFEGKNINRDFKRNLRQLKGLPFVRIENIYGYPLNDYEDTSIISLWINDQSMVLFMP